MKDLRWSWITPPVKAVGRAERCLLFNQVSTEGAECEQSGHRWPPSDLGWASKDGHRFLLVKPLMGQFHVAKHEKQVPLAGAGNCSVFPSCEETLALSQGSGPKELPPALILKTKCGCSHGPS